MHDLFYREDVFHDYDHDDKRRRGMDFTIDYQGRWYFHGVQSPGPIKRRSLAALFGGAGEGFMAGKGLQVDTDGRYWLASPDGRYQVEVEDVPFLITAYNIHNNHIDLITNFDESVPLGPGYDVVLRAEPRQGVFVFYVRVRGELWARFSTPVHHRFVNDIVQEIPGGYEFSSRGRIYRFLTNAER